MSHSKYEGLLWQKHLNIQAGPSNKELSVTPSDTSQLKQIFPDTTRLNCSIYVVIGTWKWLTKCSQRHTLTLTHSTGPRQQKTWKQIRNPTGTGDKVVNGDNVGAQKSICVQ